MNEVVILIPIVNMPHNRTEEQLVLFMSMQLQKLIDLGALKGTLDDILNDYYLDEATNYINIKIPQTALGLTNELEAVGAATCPTYKVPTDMCQYIDAADGELKTFSAATINERLRIAMRNPKLRFRYTIMDYKKFYKQKESQLKNKPEMATKLRNMFLTDIMGMFTEVLPLIEEGKQLATLVGTSQVTPKLNKVARELSLAYRRALKMEKSSNQLNKGVYSRLKKSYSEFMEILLEQVFPGLSEAQKEESRKYSRCSDGRINLFSESLDQLGSEAEKEVADEETRLLNEELTHEEEESQKEYSELGENTYIVAKYESPNKDIDSYYYDLISELHPLFDKLDKLNKNQSIREGYWKIIKITDAIELGDALKLLKKQGVKTFSDGMQEVTFRTTNPEQLTKIVNAIGECGNGGHSFEIVIDPDSTKEEGGNIRFGWDGDGSDRVEISDDKNFSYNSDNYYVVVHQNGVVDSWFGPYFRNEAEKVENEVADELESGFTVGIWSLDTLLAKLNKQRKGNYTAEQVNSHSEKRTFSDKDKDWYVVGILVTEEGDEEVYSAVQPQEEKPTKEEVLAFEPKAQDLKYFKVFANEESADAYRDGLTAKMSKSFSEAREKVSAEMLEKAKTDGVVQKKPNGSWGIISIDAGEWWTPDYESKEKAENALAAYHANKG